MQGYPTYQMPSCCQIQKETGDRAGNRQSLLGPQFSTDFPKSTKTGGRNGARRRGGEKRWKRQDVRTNSPHWLPGLFLVVLNGPEQRQYTQREKRALLSSRPAPDLSAGQGRQVGQERNRESNEKNNTMRVKR